MFSFARDAVVTVSLTSNRNPKTKVLVKTTPIQLFEYGNIHLVPREFTPVL